MLYQWVGSDSINKGLRLAMTLLYWHAVSEVIKSDSGVTKIIINYSIIYSSKNMANFIRPYAIECLGCAW